MSSYCNAIKYIQPQLNAWLGGEMNSKYSHEIARPNRAEQRNLGTRGQSQTAWTQLDMIKMNIKLFRFDYHYNGI